jgi:hypothetical protein
MAIFPLVWPTSRGILTFCAEEKIAENTGKTAKNSVSAQVWKMSKFSLAKGSYFWASPKHSFA